MSPDEPSDAILAVRCQLGDDSAWQLLVDRWHPRLWRFVSRMISDRATAEDVVQTIWLRVVRSLIRLREPERLAGWLYRIARLAVTDQLRSQYRRPPTENDVDVPQLDSEIESFELSDSLIHAMTSLHPCDREVVVLFYLEQLSVAEIAEICDVPTGTVKSRLHRARLQLRSTFEDGDT